MDTICTAIEQAITADPARAQEVAAAFRAAIIKGLASAAGTGITVKDRFVDESIPDGGALLHVEWAVSDLSYVEWYPSTSQAVAALESLAVAHGRKIEPGKAPPQVDLTAPGCHESAAWVTSRE